MDYKSNKKNIEFTIQYLKNNNQFLLTGINKTEQLALEHLTSMLPDIIFYWKDENSIYQGCNEAMVKAAGFKTSANIVGKTDYELWPEKADQLRENDLEVMRTGVKLSKEEEVIFKDGSKAYYRAIKLPWRNTKGEIMGIIGNSTDITDLKRTQYELEQAKIKAENALKVKSDFLAVMSHELRTPLTAILGMVEELIATQELKNNLKPSQDILGNIQSASNHLLGIINNILDFSKLNEDKFSLACNPFNLRDTLQQVFNILKAKALEKNIFLKLNFDSKIPHYFFGDAQALMHTLINLINNAIKFTDTGGVTVSLSAKNISPDEAEILIEIIDTGIGIPEDKIPHIFNRFEQIGYAQTTNQTGTGLGLSVSQKLIELMGSKILVESEVNKGSKFSILLKLKQDHAKLASNLNLLHDEAIVPLQKQYKLLLVEDDALIQRVHQQKFSTYGFDVELAGTGKEALRLCKKKKFDIIFMDIRLPDIIGPIIINKIRNLNSSNATIPIIGLSAYADEENQNQAIDSGANLAIAKPVKNKLLNELFAKIFPEHLK